MGERKPTIEQNSQFTAKTKQGQDVEFQTTVKFYISPRGDVRVNVPGGPRELPGQAFPGADSKPGARDKIGVEVKPGKGESQGFPRDETIDSAFPRPPDCPCPKQFIPDPCKAMNDTVQTIKGFFSATPSTPQNVNSPREDVLVDEINESNENVGGEEN